jgi:hypothetical protein
MDDIEIVLIDFDHMYMLKQELNTMLKENLMKIILELFYILMLIEVFLDGLDQRLIHDVELMPNILINQDKQLMNNQ